MDNPEGIEALGPLVQIRALSDQELKVVKARNELVEGPLGTTRVLDQTDFEPRVRLCKTRIALTFVGRLVLTADRQVQHFPIPTDASGQVGHGERWGQIARYRWHGLILPICVVGRLPRVSVAGKTSQTRRPGCPHAPVLAATSRPTGTVGDSLPAARYPTPIALVADSTPEDSRATISDVGELPSAEEVVREFMAAFITAWPTGDATALGRFFSEDAEYCNGPLEPVRGRGAIVASLTQMMSLGGAVDAEIRHLLSAQAVVMTERVDYVRFGEKTATLRIAGVFEVHDGAITGWRDYFDPDEFGAQLSGPSD
jgi:limonene-1,2-epoxide hydrolase